MSLRPKAPYYETFMFLELPAELRNNIYNMICDDEPIEYIRRTRSRQAHRYLQLAQVNRQLRQEFLPIFHRDARLHFHFDNAFEFTRDFLMPKAAKFATSPVILDLDQVTEDSAPVNFYPLLKNITKRRIFLLKAINIPSQTPARPMLPSALVHAAGRIHLKTLLDALSAPPVSLEQKKWAQYFKCCVKELWITPSLIPHIRVVVNYTATEWWMGWDGKDKHGDVPEWIRRTGFPAAEIEIRRWVMGERWTVDVEGS
ncbi:hypothetical protein EJ07DRAFT_156796 [Lizonia empirigonia]|nr:hypothetical protein EJ07DRAFT_156796 [Lizonia empirigonia]